MDTEVRLQETASYMFAVRDKVKVWVKVAWRPSPDGVLRGDVGNILGGKREL